MIAAALLLVASPSRIAATPAAATCARPSGVQILDFDAAKYPNIRHHVRAAIRRGWPRILVVHRAGDEERRDRRLADIPTKPGYDRDEYPPSVGRGRGAGLTEGQNPRGWKADVRYVPSSENRSQGASMGNQLRPFCDGTRFRYAFN
ncbi:MAG: hypothetical protein QOF76_3449 [Solirubrobacteraceae bacterium]|nr:hypothetical protein [Solirubrobacteraceae bacterium]